MKRISTIVMALALVLSLSQCKKNEQNNAENQGEAVTIMLDVSGASSGSATDGSRAVVNPNTGTVYFENNDQIIVASGGKYVGALTYNGTLFTGAISNATEGYPLQFYFLGNVTPSETLTSGVTESCSVVISDQTEYLPVISAALSNENYTASTMDYTAHLLNKCALVKFNVTTISEAATCITGLNNKVTVDFATNELAYSQDGAGSIALPAGNGERWAILLPQDEVTDAVVNSYDGIYTGTCGTIPAIAANDYLTDGIAANTSHRAGVIEGLFSVSATQQVRFSKGNLQYIGSAGNGDDNNTGGYWKFADHQWDYIGETTPQATDSKTIDRDLFGWATSGYAHNSYIYQPWGISATNSSYKPYNNNFVDIYGQADWGYNAIRNGGNAENSGWRTPSFDDWYYLFNTRSTASGIGWVVGSVNGVNGYILLPDDWSAAYYALNHPNDNSNGWGSNTISAEDWTNTLEAHGAVFLPAAGWRYSRKGIELIGGDIIRIEKVGRYGNYWSSNHYEATRAYMLYFANTMISTTSYIDRCYGLSVRLVRDAE